VKGTPLNAMLEQMQMADSKSLAHMGKHLRQHQNTASFAQYVQLQHRTT
jgi:hypothetical protein